MKLTEPAHVGNPIAHSATEASLDSVMAAADDAADAYNVGPTAPPGQTFVRYYPPNGPDPLTGFYAKLYRNADGTYTLAYRGTVPDVIHHPLDALGTIGTDIQGTVDGATPQFNEAIAAANDAQSQYGNVTMTGHSLGGLLAGMGSLSTGQPGITFNAAGMNPLTPTMYGLNTANGANVDNYTTPHDILGPERAVLPAIGNQHELPDTTPEPTAPKGWSLLNPIADIKYLAGRVSASVSAHSAYLDALKKAAAGEEHIATGLQSVRLGPATKPAALAISGLCIGDIHHLTMQQGSSTVRLSPGTNPMSRRTDASTCSGLIMQGLQSVLVGG